MLTTTDQKGAIAEMRIAWDAANLGVDVYKPVSEDATASSSMSMVGSGASTASGPLS
jgi:hypothetical protein